jgi:hypothetical protein
MLSPIENFQEPSSRIKKFLSSWALATKTRNKNVLILAARMKYFFTQNYFNCYLILIFLFCLKQFNDTGLVLPKLYEYHIDISRFYANCVIENL